MKHLTKLIAFLFFIYSTLNSFAQIDPFSAIGLGTGLGKGIVGKIKDSKKKKAIASSISEIEINGVKLMALRVPEDKIISNAKGYIVRIQEQLDNFNRQYKNKEHLDIPYYYDDVTTLKALDKEWATDYYDNELKEYRNYEQKLVLAEKLINESIENAKREEQKRISDNILLARKKSEDSLAFVERVQGYFFVNKEFTLLKEKPSDKSKTIGKVYIGSYMKFLGYSDNSFFIKVLIQNIEGFVDKRELTDSIDKINVSIDEIKTYKGRRYYKYEPNYEFKEEQLQNLSSTASSSSIGKTKSSLPQIKTLKQTIRYIRGPKGGCYYISGGSKIYVDRGYCN